MTDNKKINLFREELVLLDYKLYFNDHLIHDFNDKVSNCSSVAMEDQNKEFLTLVKMVYEAPLSPIIRAETVIILATLYHVFSTRNSSTDIMLVGESSFTGVYEYVLRLFHQDNSLYELCPEKTQKPEKSKNLQYIAISSDYNLHSLPKKLLTEHRYGIILIDCDAVQNSLSPLLEACSKLIRKGGQLLCIGSGWFDPDYMEIPDYFEGNVYQLEDERFVLVLDISTPSFTRSEEAARADQLTILHRIKEKLANLIDTLLTPPDEECSAKWHRRMDYAILMSSELEHFINNNSILFLDKDLKYKVNEVKNALLDLKYEVQLSSKDFIFFRDQVSKTFSELCEVEY